MPKEKNEEKGRILLDAANTPDDENLEDVVQICARRFVARLETRRRREALAARAVKWACLTGIAIVIATLLNFAAISSTLRTVVAESSLPAPADAPELTEN